MPKCKVCGGTNLAPDPAGYYCHAFVESGPMKGAPLLCLAGKDGSYIEPRHTTHKYDLCPEDRKILDAVGWERLRELKGWRYNPQPSIEDFEIRGENRWAAH